MPSREHKVAVLYVRVSTDEQDVNNQLPDIQAYCQRQGYTIGKVYEEAGRQGDDANRPAWTALRKAAFGYRPGFDAVVAFDATRYSRDLIPFLLDVREFANHGIRLETVREGHLELDSEAGLVLTAVQGAFAQNEKRRIKARVQASVKAAKARGAQFGRKRAFDPELFIRLRSEGLSQRKRARRLGVSQPQVHHHDRVLGVLEAHYGGAA